MLFAALIPNSMPVGQFVWMTNRWLMVLDAKFLRAFLGDWVFIYIIYSFCLTAQ